MATRSADLNMGDEDSLTEPERPLRLVESEEEEEPAGLSTERGAKGATEAGLRSTGGAWASWRCHSETAESLEQVTILRQSVAMEMMEPEAPEGEWNVSSGAGKRRFSWVERKSQR